MTVISAVISKRCISVASDSLITLNNGEIQLEKKRPKIVKVERLHAVLSYWGFAAKSRYGIWTTYDFLKRMVRDSTDCTTIKQLASYIKSSLENEIGPTLRQRSQGIGIHLVGYTQFENDYLPEFYLITNFKNPKYEVGDNINFSSELYKTLPSTFRTASHPSENDKFIGIRNFLNENHIFVFNNGDPDMFNPLYNGCKNSIHIAKERGCQVNDDKEQARFLAREPIERVANAQKCIFREGKRIVGGRVHDIVLEKNGFHYSQGPRSGKIE